MLATFDKPQTIVIVNKTTIRIRKKQIDREIKTNKCTVAKSTGELERLSLIMSLSKAIHGIDYRRR